MKKNICSLCFSLLFLTNCYTTGDYEQPYEPVTEDMTIEDSILLTIKTGGENKTITRKRIEAYKPHNYPAKFLQKIILEQFKTWDKRETINAIYLFQTSLPEKIQIKQVFEKLVRDEAYYRQKSAWILAHAKKI